MIYATLAHTSTYTRCMVLLFGAAVPLLRISFTHTRRAKRNGRKYDEHLKRLFALFFHVFFKRATLFTNFLSSDSQSAKLHTFTSYIVYYIIFILIFHVRTLFSTFAWLLPCFHREILFKNVIKQVNCIIFAQCTHCKHAARIELPLAFIYIYINGHVSQHHQTEIKDFGLTKTMRMFWQFN